MIVNVAAVTVPTVAGNVTPPVLARVPAGASITVPAVPEAAILPKFISRVFAILMGVTMLTDELAVAEACANKLLLAIITIPNAKLIIR